MPMTWLDMAATTVNTSARRMCFVLKPRHHEDDLSSTILARQAVAATLSRIAKGVMKPRPASRELERLNAFVGVWETEGELATESAQPPTKFRATDTYEWLPGGYFLLHRFDADMPSGKVEGIEVIGYSPKADSYPMKSFDSLGNASAMEARLQEDTWTFVGNGIRFTGGFRADGRVFAGRWESRPSEGVPWQAWMEVTLTKVD